MKVKFITLGCKVNQYETQALRERFISEGFQVVSSAADICVINTCTVTARADSKSRENILRARRENPGAKIAVTGCLAQRDREKLAGLDVDFIVPQNEKSQLVDIVLNKPLTAPDTWALGVSTFGHQRAFVKIQDGCNNRCSFCKVPLVRGNSVSRPPDAVLEEIQRVSRVHKEIVLCGINICLYGRDLSPAFTLSQLIEKVVSTPWLGRLRLSSLEPYLVDTGLMGWFSYPKVCHHAHFPFQSGDDQTLKLMNKKENVRLYEELVGKLRIVNPAIAISCDIITGIPGESDASFDRTIAFLERVKPMRMHVFPFSPREGTPLAGVKAIGTGVVKKRCRVLAELAERCADAYKRQYLGSTVQMISEEHSRGHTLGYTQHYLRVALEGRVALGEMLSVKVKKILDDGTVLVSRCK